MSAKGIFRSRDQPRARAAAAIIQTMATSAARVTTAGKTSQPTHMPPVAARLHVAQAKSFRAAAGGRRIAASKEDAAAYDARQRRMCEGGER